MLAQARLGSSGSRRAACQARPLTPYTVAMQAPETELKFSTTDSPAFRNAVQALGLVLRTERSFETNTLYDTPGRDLRQQRQLLRLRRYNGTCILTHKRVAEGNASEDTRYKTRIETETAVEDGDALAEVFAQLGYVPVFRYEKFRTEWDGAGGGHLVLDETPIGTWAELEGQPAWIESMLEALEINRDRVTTASYGALFLSWRERHGSKADNLTFDEIGPEKTE